MKLVWHIALVAVSLGFTQTVVATDLYYHWSGFLKNGWHIVFERGLYDQFIQYDRSTYGLDWKIMIELPPGQKAVVLQEGSHPWAPKAYPVILTSTAYWYDRKIIAYGRFKKDGVWEGGGHKFYGMTKNLAVWTQKGPKETKKFQYLQTLVGPAIVLGRTWYWAYTLDSRKGYREGKETSVGGWMCDVHGTDEDDSPCAGECCDKKACCKWDETCIKGKCVAKPYGSTCDCASDPMGCPVASCDAGSDAELCCKAYCAPKKLQGGDKKLTCNKENPGITEYKGSQHLSCNCEGCDCLTDPIGCQRKGCAEGDDAYLCCFRFCGGSPQRTECEKGNMDGIMTSCQCRDGKRKDGGS